MSSDDCMLATLSRIGTVAPEVIELLDYLEDTPMWMKDEAGHYEWANVSFLLNFGVKTRAEIIGRTDYDFCGEVLANQYRIDDERVLRGERLLSRVELVGRFNHTARWCVTSKVPLRDAKGATVGTAGVTRPLSHREATARRHSHGFAIERGHPAISARISPTASRTKISPKPAACRCGRSNASSRPPTTAPRTTTSDNCASG